MSVAAMSHLLSPEGRRFAARYVAASVVLHLGWEAMQLPLYSFPGSERWNAKLFAVAHCTAGDLLIAASCLALAVLIIGGRVLPPHRFLAVAGATMAFGLAYTIFSEWLNLRVRESWSYTPDMPVLPPLGTGLTPLLQWLVVPALALGWAVLARPRASRLDPAA